MTLLEVVDGLRAIASVLEVIPQAEARKVMCHPMFKGESAAGAGIMLLHIRKALTMTERENWNRAEILVLLEEFSRDAELFPIEFSAFLWDMEHDAPQEP